MNNLTKSNLDIIHFIKTGELDGFFLNQSNIKDVTNRYGELDDIIEMGKIKYLFLSEYILIMSNTDKLIGIEIDFYKYEIEFNTKDIILNKFTGLSELLYFFNCNGIQWDMKGDIINKEIIGIVTNKTYIYFSVMDNSIQKIVTNAKYR